MLLKDQQAPALPAPAAIVQKEVLSKDVKTNAGWRHVVSGYRLTIIDAYRRVSVEYMIYDCQLRETPNAIVTWTKCRCVLERG